MRVRPFPPPPALPLPAPLYSPRPRGLPPRTVLGQSAILSAALPCRSASLSQLKDDGDDDLLFFRHPHSNSQTPWLLTVFARTLDMDTTLQLWDQYILVRDFGFLAGCAGVGSSCLSNCVYTPHAHPHALTPFLPPSYFSRRTTRCCTCSWCWPSCGGTRRRCWRVGRTRCQRPSPPCASPATSRWVGDPIHLHARLHVCIFRLILLTRYPPRHLCAALTQVKALIADGKRLKADTPESYCRCVRACVRVLIFIGYIHTNRYVPCMIRA